MDQIILVADARVAAMPVIDCGEDLVDVSDDQQVLVDARNADPGGAFTLLRRGVYDRLLKAQAQLPDGLRLLFAEGYRPPALQRHYFAGHAAELAAAHPEWTAEQVHVAASRFVSPPDIAPHSAGAAVDLTLAGADGQELDMGCPIDSSPEESDGACYTRAVNISDENQPGRPRRGAHRRRLRQLPDRVVALVVRRPVLGPGHRPSGRHLRVSAFSGPASRRAAG